MLKYSLGMKCCCCACTYIENLHIHGCTSLCDVFVCRSAAPPPPDSLGCVSLFLDLLNTLLSCEVRGLTESSPRGEHRHMNRKVVMAMIPKPLLKSIVVKPSGENLLSQLNNDIQV